MDFLRALITAPVSIAVLFLLSKFIGNKQMSSLNLFDYINGITIGSIAAEMATAEMSDFWACLAALIVYVIIVMLCSWLSQKSTMLRRFLTGKSIVIFDRGKLYKKNFSVAKIDINEFLTRMREKGYFSLDDVETVFLEQNGDLSVLPKDKKRPATPDDLKIIVHQTRPESVVITDGKILEKNLAESGFNLEWLKKQLDNNRKRLKDVFLGVCDDTGNLKIYQDGKAESKNDIFD